MVDHHRENYKSAYNCNKIKMKEVVVEGYEQDKYKGFK